MAQLPAYVCKQCGLGVLVRQFPLPHIWGCAHEKGGVILAQMDAVVSQNGGVADKAKD